MKTKSVGLSIVLTLIFGPLGLFYSTIKGGLIMTLTPFLFLILFLGGVFSGNTFLFATSFLFLIIFALSYWIICVIWSITAVNNFNNSLLESKRHLEHEVFQRHTEKSNENYQIKNNIEKDNLLPKEEINTGQPSFQEWKKTNPYSSINDYYKTYGPPKSTATLSNIEHSYPNDEVPKKTLFIVGAVLILFISFVVLTINRGTKSFSFDNLTSIFGVSSEKKDIENQIEIVYYGLMNGAYTAQSLTGTTPENLPFYNSNLTTFVAMGFAPFSMLNGSISVEPKNIEILKVYDNMADVSYDLVVSRSDTRKTTTWEINMTLKKIGGKWKLDGQKFLPFDQNKN